MEKIIDNPRIGLAAGLLISRSLFSDWVCGRCAGVQALLLRRSSNQERPCINSDARSVMVRSWIVRQLLSCRRYLS